MRLLSLDLSTSTGFAVFDGTTLVDSGNFEVEIQDFNVSDYPEKSDLYPWNLMDSANEIAGKVLELIEKYKPTHVLAENTVCGRNRHTQRCLEWIHYVVLASLFKLNQNWNFAYIDVSEWRKILGLYMTPEDKKNNRLVSEGKARGKINKKHLAIRYVKETFGLDLLMKENDRADAICQGWAHLKKLGVTG